MSTIWTVFFRLFLLKKNRTTKKIEYRSQESEERKGGRKERLKAEVKTKKQKTEVRSQPPSLANRWWAETMAAKEYRIYMTDLESGKSENTHQVSVLKHFLDKSYSAKRLGGLYGKDSAVNSFSRFYKTRRRD